MKKFIAHAAVDPSMPWDALPLGFQWSNGLRFAHADVEAEYLRITLPISPGRGVLVLGIEIVLSLLIVFMDVALDQRYARPLVGLATGPKIGPFGIAGISGLIATVVFFAVLVAHWRVSRFLSTAQEGNHLFLLTSDAQLAKHYQRIEVLSLICVFFGMIMSSMCLTLRFRALAWMLTFATTGQFFVIAVCAPRCIWALPLLLFGAVAMIIMSGSVDEGGINASSQFYFIVALFIIVREVTFRRAFVRCIVELRNWQLETAHLDSAIRVAAALLPVSMLNMYARPSLLRRNDIDPELLKDNAPPLSNDRTTRPSDAEGHSSLSHEHRKDEAEGLLRLMASPSPDALHGRVFVAMARVGGAASQDFRWDFVAQVAMSLATGIDLELLPTCGDTLLCASQVVLFRSRSDRSTGASRVAHAQHQRSATPHIIPRRDGAIRVARGLPLYLWTERLRHWALHVNLEVACSIDYVESILTVDGGAEGAHSRHAAARVLPGTPLASPALALVCARSETLHRLSDMCQQLTSLQRVAPFGWMSRSTSLTDNAFSRLSQQARRWRRAAHRCEREGLDNVVASAMTTNLTAQRRPVSLPSWTIADVAPELYFSPFRGFMVQSAPVVVPEQLFRDLGRARPVHRRQARATESSPRRPQARSKEACEAAAAVSSPSRLTAAVLAVSSPLADRSSSNRVDRVTELARGMQTRLHLYHLAQSSPPPRHSAAAGTHWETQLRGDEESTASTLLGDRSLLRASILRSQAMLLAPGLFTQADEAGAPCDASSVSSFFSSAISSASAPPTRSSCCPPMEHVTRPLQAAIRSMTSAFGNREPLETAFYTHRHSVFLAGSVVAAVIIPTWVLSDRFVQEFLEIAPIAPTTVATGLVCYVVCVSLVITGLIWCLFKDAHWRLRRPRGRERKAAYQRTSSQGARRMGGEGGLAHSAAPQRRWRVSDFLPTISCLEPAFLRPPLFASDIDGAAAGQTTIGRPRSAGGRLLRHRNPFFDALFLELPMAVFALTHTLKPFAPDLTLTVAFGTLGILLASFRHNAVLRVALTVAFVGPAAISNSAVYLVDEHQFGFTDAVFVALVFLTISVGHVAYAIHDGALASRRTFLSVQCVNHQRRTTRSEIVYWAKLIACVCPATLVVPMVAAFPTDNRHRVWSDEEDITAMMLLRLPVMDTSLSPPSRGMAPSTPAIIVEWQSEFHHQLRQLLSTGGMFGAIQWTSLCDGSYLFIHTAAQADLSRAVLADAQRQHAGENGGNRSHDGVARAADRMDATNDDASPTLVSGTLAMLHDVQDPLHVATLEMWLFASVLHELIVSLMPKGSRGERAMPTASPERPASADCASSRSLPVSPTLGLPAVCTLHIGRWSCRPIGYCHEVSQPSRGGPRKTTTHAVEQQGGGLGCPPSPAPSLLSSRHGARQERPRPRLRGSCLLHVKGPGVAMLHDIHRALSVQSTMKPSLRSNESGGSSSSSSSSSLGSGEGRRPSHDGRGGGAVVGCRPRGDDGENRQEDISGRGHFWFRVAASRAFIEAAVVAVTELSRRSDDAIASAVRLVPDGFTETVGPRRHHTPATPLAMPQADAAAAGLAETAAVLPLRRLLARHGLEEGGVGRQPAGRTHVTRSSSAPLHFADVLPLLVLSDAFTGKVLGDWGGSASAESHHHGVRKDDNNDEGSSPDVLFDPVRHIKPRYWCPLQLPAIGRIVHIVASPFYDGPLPM